MKISQSIGDIYDEQRGRFDRLSNAAEALIRGHILKEWHFIGRVKERESFALKMETGRVSDPRQMEDFYACTIVVRNMLEVAQAETIMSENFEVVERRPPRADTTRFEPSSFEFDHLRLYVRWRDDDRLPPTEFSKITFEVQIKTYLQHAWAIATHDLVYKTDDVNWSKARIAYQIKAMLDHAETSIAHAGQLATVATLQVSNQHFDQIKAVIDLLKQTWTDPGRLPADIRRLAETVLDLTRNLNLTVADLRADLLAEQDEGRGPLIETLSPFGIVVRTMFVRRATEMRRLLTTADRRGRRGFRILIPAEVDLPDGLARTDCVRAIFVDAV